MFQVGDDLNFPTETIQVPGIGKITFPQKLDRDLPIGTKLNRSKDDSLATPTDRFLDSITGNCRRSESGLRFLPATVRGVGPPGIG